MSDFDNEKVYYDLGRLLSFNKLLSISIGARGLGKSYAAKRWAINNFLKNKKQFIYIRRYKTEFNNIKNYFSDIQDRYPDHKFSVGRGEFIIDGEVAGYYIGLSTSQTQKSNSFPNVNIIIFDEFIIDKGKLTYIKGETQLFLDMIETIARTRDDVRILMISNAISSINPYFLMWNIYPREGDRFICKDQIIVEINKNIDFINFKKQTKFGQLIDGTEYGKYAIENAFLRDNKEFIEKIEGRAHCMYGIKINGRTYSVWSGIESGLLYMTKKDVENGLFVYAITDEDHQKDLLRIHKQADILKRLKMIHDIGLLRFDCLESKSAFYEIMNL